MAIVLKNTNYNGEVLDRILTLAATGNELVEKGLIHVIPGVSKKISLPRLKTGKMLQKRKEDPAKTDSKGDFNYDEKSLDPEDFMAILELSSMSGVNGSQMVTLCLQNCHPKDRTHFLTSCRSRCSLNLVGTM